MTKIQAYVEQLLEDCEIQYQSWVEASVEDTASPPRDIDPDADDRIAASHHGDVVVAFPLDAAR